MLDEKVKKFISSNSLISTGESVLVAFSGGADSMCLLNILKSLNYKVSAAHLNHMLRGSEADRDEEIAREFCKKHDIPFFICRVDVAKIAKSEGVSEETAGRQERYNFFDKIVLENGIDKIATAHNKNDNAETILMHLIRGCGTNGLAGIPKARGNIIRPLIDCSRSEIENYCAEKGLAYATDSTNYKNIYTRNKVRNELMPVLTEYNENILSAFSALSEIMSADKAYFSCLINEMVNNKTSLKLNEINELPDSLLLRGIVKLAENAGLSPEFKHVKCVAELIKSGISGKKLDVPGGFFEISCGKISALKTIPQSFNYSITPETDLELENYKIIGSDRVLSDTFFVLPLQSDIIVRSRMPGDKIKIRGMTKKLSDLFIDKKIPASDRDKIPVLSVNDEIIYVFGIEKSDLTNEFTKSNKTFVLNIQNKEYTNE